MPGVAFPSSIITKEEAFASLILYWHLYDVINNICSLDLQSQLGCRQEVLVSVVIKAYFLLRVICFDRQRGYY